MKRSRPKLATKPKSPTSLLAAPKPAGEGGPLFHWLQARGAGLLLHPTCLPGDQGCGVFDRHAVRFLDFLQDAGMKYWQVCPLGPTGYGDSPYQCFSAFAGNAYLVDLAALIPFGLITAGDLAPLAALSSDRTDYGGIYKIKPRLLASAYAQFKQQRPTLPYGDFAAFCQKHAPWLDAYAYYRALKDHFNGVAWWEWPVEARDYAHAKKSPLRAQLADAIAACQFGQYLFFGQWAQVRAAARVRGVEIIGDLPIFVAADSADAWANPGLFELDPKTLLPLAVAGVPPDYFSADGQLWGNPFYRWAAHRADGYVWWLARMRASFELCDVVRIDHFRGFDSCWRIPFPAKNARVGEWVPGPGLELFRAFQRAFPAARIIAEDLGELTDSVTRLRSDSGLPGMMVLQFAWGNGATNGYLPHNAVPNSVIYPGTHDNDTTAGWYQAAPEAERDHVRRYLRVDGSDIAWDFIRASYVCASRLAILTLPDLFSLGTAARFNTPAKTGGNWQWRYRAATLEKAFGSTAKHLRELSTLYGR